MWQPNNRENPKPGPLNPDILKPSCTQHVPPALRPRRVGILLVALTFVSESIGSAVLDLTMSVCEANDTHTVSQLL